MATKHESGEQRRRGRSDMGPGTMEMVASGRLLHQCDGQAVGSGARLHQRIGEGAEQKINPATCGGAAQSELQGRSHDRQPFMSDLPASRSRKGIYAARAANTHWRMFKPSPLPGDGLRVCTTGTGAQWPRDATCPGVARMQVANGSCLLRGPAARAVSARV